MAEKLDLRENVSVVVPNRFIKAHMDSDMEENAQKLFRIAIAQCKMNDADFGVYQVGCDELATIIGSSKSSVSKHIKKWTMSCMKCLMLEENSKKKNDFKIYHIFDKCEYVDGVLTMQLHREMIPLVLEIQKRLGFTQYQLAKILTMKGKYSIRIFEMIVMEMKNKPVYGDKKVTVELDLEEMRKQTNTIDKFKQIGQFKDYVLKITEREIELSMGCKLEREDIKNGRTVTGFKYTLKSPYDNSFLSEDDKRRIELTRKKGNKTITPEESEELEILKMQKWG